MTDLDIVLYIVISIVIMSVFALGVILFFNVSQKKIQEETLKTQELKINFQKELLEQTVQTQEKERNRIARELHDDIGSKLNVIHLNLHLLKSDAKKGKDIGAFLDDIDIALQASIETSRQISHELMPPTLRKFGIQAAIEDLQGSINRTGKLKFLVNEITPWTLKNEMAQLHLYRIIQELVQNALKHAQAEHLTFSFEETDQQLNVIYKDDGVGFPEEIKSKGLGMSNLETRVQILQGHWEINRQVVQGTEININIPK